MSATTRGDQPNRRTRKAPAMEKMNMAEKMGWLGAQVEVVKEKTDSIEDKLDGHITDTREQFSKIATQHQEIKDILLTKQVASATRIGIARSVAKRAAWIIATVLAALVAAAGWHKH